MVRRRWEKKMFHEILNPLVKETKEMVDDLKKEIENKDRYKCTKCEEILSSQKDVMAHKEENWDHFEYSLIGTSMKLCFV